MSNSAKVGLGHKQEFGNGSSAEPDHDDLQQQHAEKHSNDEHDEITNDRRNVHPNGTP